MTAYTDSAYVAWGVDEEADTERYWIAIWDNDGPQSPETFRTTREAAAIYATYWGTQVGLEAVEVDEFGAVTAA